VVIAALCLAFFAAFAAFRAIFYLIPHLFPFFPPGKGALANRAGLLQQMRFFMRQGSGCRSQMVVREFPEIGCFDTVKQPENKVLEAVNPIA
jgi:hypothetical protein